MAHYWTLVGMEPMACDNVHEWSEWFATGNRIVAQTTLPNGLFVSTVFLGIDMSLGAGPPILFETLVFPMCDDEVRYATWTEAVAGHDAIVRALLTDGAASRNDRP